MCSEMSSQVQVVPLLILFETRASLVSFSNMQIYDINKMNFRLNGKKRVSREMDYIKLQFFLSAFAYNF